jgi:hypothetical protein
MAHSDSSKRITWWEIISTVAFKTLPLVAAVSLLFKYARGNFRWAADLPAFFFNAVLVVAFLLIVQLTAGRMLRSLAKETPEGGK